MSNTLDNNQPDPRRETGLEVSRIEVDVSIDPCLQVLGGTDSGIDRPRLVESVRAAAIQRGFAQGTIGVRITDDETITELNRQYLSHDYATDVISFGYQADPPRLAGEMVISAETARQRAAEIGWSATHEMMLYVIHGTLHITGMDDGDRDQRAAMRAAEREVMHRLGVAQIDAHGADCGLSAPRRAEEHA